MTDIRLTVDGAALQNPTSYSAGSGCFELEDVSRGQNGSAAGDGYWVFLKPLPPGRHEIAFGGKYIADGLLRT